MLFFFINPIGSSAGGWGARALFRGVIPDRGPPLPSTVATVAGSTGTLHPAQRASCADSTPIQAPSFSAMLQPVVQPRSWRGPFAEPGAREDAFSDPGAGEGGSRPHKQLGWKGTPSSRSQNLAPRRRGGTGGSPLIILGRRGKVSSPSIKFFSAW